MTKRVIKITDLPGFILAEGLGFIFGLAIGVLFIIMGIAAFNLPFIGGILGVVLIMGGILMPIGGLGAIRISK